MNPACIGGGECRPEKGWRDCPAHGRTACWRLATCSITVLHTHVLLSGPPWYGDAVIRPAPRSEGAMSQETR